MLDKEQLEEESSVIDAKAHVTEADQNVESAEVKVLCKWNEMYHCLAGYHYHVGHFLPLKRHAMDQEESKIAKWYRKELTSIFWNWHTSTLYILNDPHSFQ
eukprot:13107973-Ditylum_brightwellii.AAC.1